MSKSSGEFLTLSTIISHGYDPLDYRYLCLGAHYRSQLKFSYEALDHARSARLSLIDKIKALKSGAKASDSLGEKALEYKREYDEALDNDLHTPQALAAMWSLLKDAEVPDGEKLSLVLYMDKVFSLNLDKVEAEEKIGSAEDLALLEQRSEAKKNKDYARADEIRKILLERGYTVKDTPSGSILVKNV